MRPAEATSTESTTAAGYKPASARVLDSATGQFASILSMTRRSSQRVMDALKSGAQQETTSTKTRAKDRNSKAADRKARGAEDSRPKVDSTKEDERADEPRAKQRVQDAAAADQQQVRDESTDRKAIVAEAMPAQHDERPANSGAFAVGNIAATVQAASASTAGASTTGAVGQVASGNDASAFVPRVMTGATNAVTGKGWNVDPPANVAAGVSPTQNTAASPANAGDAAGTESVNAMAGAGAKQAAEGAAARATGSGSAGDFQNLLAQLGRNRVGQADPAQPVDAKSKAASVADKATVDMESTESLNDLARVVRSKAGSRDSSMTLAMSPPELGRLRVEVKMEQDGLNVHFQTETPGGEDALKGKLHELKAALEQQGVKVDRMDVEYVPPVRDNGSDQNAGSQAHSDGRHFQTPSDSGQWARHTGQSFDAPRQARVDWEPEAEMAAGLPMSSIPSWIGLSSGVDLVA